MEISPQHPDEIGAANVPLSGHDAATLGERIGALHEHLRRNIPQVDRMACALYDPGMDMLKTFVNSTVGGQPLKAYQYKLGHSPSLIAIRDSRKSRVIDDISTQLTSETEHTRWVKSMGYLSSYTVPIFHQGIFEDFFLRFLPSCRVHSGCGAQTRGLREPHPAHGGARDHHRAGARRIGPRGA